MIKEVFMPKMGQTMEEGVIEKWHKKEGDYVNKGEVLLEITTDKATIEVESFEEGYLRKIVAKEGETVPVGEVIGYLADSMDEEIPEKAPAGEAPESAEKKEEKTEVTTEVEEKPTVVEAGEEGRRIKASPLARKLARELGIDLASVQGSGPGGRIVKADVLRAAEEGQVVREVPRKPAGAEKISPMRRVIAQRLSESKQTIPHFYMVSEVDASELLKFKEELTAKSGGVKVSVTHILLKAVAQALLEFPALNASWGEDEILYHDRVDLGIAVALQDGLVVPVIEDAANKSIAQIAKEARQLAELARAGKLPPDKMQGSTFTVTNLGMYGVDHFFAIINPPEAAILAIGTIADKVVALGGGVFVRPYMTLTLSCDHRVVDGAVAAQFMGRLKEILENPRVLE